MMRSDAEIEKCICIASLLTSENPSTARLRRLNGNGLSSKATCPIDNNTVERAIRPFVIGMKNWLSAIRA